jgi:hypothetical protein
VKVEDESIARKVIALIDDPNREFIPSIFLRLELLPKAIFNRQEDAVKFIRLTSTPQIL